MLHFFAQVSKKLELVCVKKIFSSPVGLCPYRWSETSLNGVRSDMKQSDFPDALNPENQTTFVVFRSDLDSIRSLFIDPSFLGSFSRIFFISLTPYSKAKTLSYGQSFNLILEERFVSVAECNTHIYLR